MSAQTANDARPVDTYRLAAELGVDATLLRRFVLCWMCDEEVGGVGL